MNHINTQPAAIRQIINLCALDLRGDTEYYSFSGRISANQLEAIKSEASLSIPQIGHYAKGGEGYEWMAKIYTRPGDTATVTFVFSDYEGQV